MRSPSSDWMQDDLRAYSSAGARCSERQALFDFIPRAQTYTYSLKALCVSWQKFQIQITTTEFMEFIRLFNLFELFLATLVQSTAVSKYSPTELLVYCRFLFEL